MKKYNLYGQSKYNQSTRKIKGAIMLRCKWVNDEQIYIDYHDNEWGVPQHDERILFEMLNLEGQQAGLSWITVLKKREDYKLLFENFDPEKLIKFTQNDIDRLLLDSRIIRNKLKVNAIIINAKAYFKLIEDFDSLDNFLWSQVNNQPIINNFRDISEIPTQTELSESISKKLKKYGFKFVGPTIIYAYLQAIGIVNDHTTDCFKHRIQRND